MAKTTVNSGSSNTPLTHPAYVATFTGRRNDRAEAPVASAETEETPVVLVTPVAETPEPVRKTRAKKAD